MNTPKAFANFSPGGWSASDNLGYTSKNRNKLFMFLLPGLSLRSKLWAEISERLRRIHSISNWRSTDLPDCGAERWI